jgi:hypothetical protein
LDVSWHVTAGHCRADFLLDISLLVEEEVEEEMALTNQPFLRPRPTVGRFRLDRPGLLILAALAAMAGLIA